MTKWWKTKAYKHLCTKCCRAWTWDKSTTCYKCAKKLADTLRANLLKMGVSI